VQKAKVDKQNQRLADIEAAMVKAREKQEEKPLKEKVQQYENMLAIARQQVEQQMPIVNMMQQMQADGTFERFMQWQEYQRAA
jgi:hypothetical protein